MSDDFDLPERRESRRARSSKPADYLGTARVNGLVVQRWKSVAGIIAIAWNTYDGPPTPDVELGEELRDLGVEAALRAMPHFGIGGPALHPVSIPGVADPPEVAWNELAEALGQPLPYWPIPMQQRKLIDAWQPGRLRPPPSKVPGDAPARPQVSEGSWLQAVRSAWIVCG